MSGLFQTGFKEDGVDVGDIYLEKATLIDVYPYLIDSAKAPGIWGWGNNMSGQLGNNSVSNRSSPVQTVSGSSNWKQVSTSGQREATTDFATSAAIKTDGTLWLWGSNANGELGTGNTTDKSSPVQTIAAGTNWKQVDLGTGNTAAIKTDGTLWLWGTNANGSLGTGNTIDRSSPVQTISGGTNWKQVSLGEYCSAAIKTDGTLWLWGNNSNGQLGDGTTVNKSSPIQTIAGGTNWKQVSANQSHVATIKTDGTLWSWGDNLYGQLGDGTTVDKSSPVQTIAGGTNWKQVSAGASQTAAIKTDGTLWLWGNNPSGQLGDNTVVLKSSPVQTIAGGANWKQVSLGKSVSQNHTTAIKTDGTLWLWGCNSREASFGGVIDGRLGTGDTIDRSSPVQTIAGGTNWKQVSAGYMNTFAIKEGDEF